MIIYNPSVASTGGSATNLTLTGTTTLTANKFVSAIGVNAQPPNTLGLYVSKSTATVASALFSAAADTSITSSESNSAVNSIRALHAGDTPIVGNQVTMIRARGTLSTPTAVADGDYCGDIQWQAYDGASRTGVARILGVVDGAVASLDTPGRLMFMTTPSGASQPVERMRVARTGNVNIGTAGVDPTSLLQLSGGALNCAPFTVATLPVSPVLGDVVRVTDALTPVIGAAVVGGGEVNVLVGRGPTQWSVVAILL
jgi:hypothetical protein